MYISISLPISGHISLYVSFQYHILSLYSISRYFVIPFTCTCQFNLEALTSLLGINSPTHLFFVPSIVQVDKLPTVNLSFHKTTDQFSPSTYMSIEITLPHPFFYLSRLTAFSCAPPQLSMHPSSKFSIQPNSQASTHSTKNKSTNPTIHYQKTDPVIQSNIHDQSNHLSINLWLNELLMNKTLFHPSIHAPIAWSLQNPPFFMSIHH